MKCTYTHDVLNNFSDSYSPTKYWTPDDNSVRFEIIKIKRTRLGILIDQANQSETVCYSFNNTKKRCIRRNEYYDNICKIREVWQITTNILTHVHVVATEINRKH